ncbi:hypothetical protein [Sulfobacillus sp. hq2]|nr:hypothetical protein [Sulfobacillus sp. hq2]MCY0907758.1 hypothetical protein [Sulfobacillus thermotolerans]
MSFVTPMYGRSHHMADVEMVVLTLLLYAAMVALLHFLEQLS